MATTWNTFWKLPMQNAWLPGLFSPRGRCGTPKATGFSSTCAGEPGAIFKLTPGGEPEIYREPSNGSNGLTFDLDGRLVMCEGDGRRMSRREHDGSIVALAERVGRKTVEPA